MTLFRLPPELIFPNPNLAEPDGMLAIGGDLSPQRLLLAYRAGIFPWFNQGDPIVWWSPNPRLLIYPSEIHCSRSMKRLFKQGRFQLSFDQAFTAVVTACATSPRVGQKGTWIIPEMIEAYRELHQLGFAHSIEVWEQGELVGGLYGVSLGGAFFGESMFSKVPNGSKFALISLAQQLESWGFFLIDCQLPTNHLASLGAVEVSRELFLSQLAESSQKKTRQGPWIFGS